MMLAIRIDFKNDEQATTAWADETTVSHVFFQSLGCLDEVNDE